MSVSACEASCVVAAALTDAATIHGPSGANLSNPWRGRNSQLTSTVALSYQTHLTEAPLWHTTRSFLESLPFACAHIISSGVSRDVIERVLDVDVFTVPSDDDAQFTFIVGFSVLRTSRDRNDLVVVGN